MSFNLILSGIYLAGGFVTFLLGFTILRQNPRNMVNRATALMLFCGGSGPILGVFDTLTEPLIAPGTFLYTNLVTNFEYVWEFFFPSLLLFALTYPRTSRVLRRFPHFTWLIFIPHVFHLLLLVLFSGKAAFDDLIPYIDPESVPGGVAGVLNEIVELLNILLSLLFRAHRFMFSIVNVFYAAVAMAVLVRNLQNAVIPRVKRQLAAVLLGLGLCVGTYSAAKFFPIILRRELPLLWESGLVNTSLILGSMSIAYAIIRYQFLDMRLLARRTVLYAAVVVFFALFYFLVLKQITHFLARYSEINQDLVDTVFMVVALLIFQPVVARVEEFAEQLIPGESETGRPTILGLSKDLVSMYDFEDIRTRVTETLRESLTVRYVDFVRAETKDQKVYIEGEMLDESHDDARRLVSGIRTLIGIAEPISMKDLFLVSPELEPEPASGRRRMVDSDSDIRVKIEELRADRARRREDAGKRYLERLRLCEVVVPLIMNNEMQGWIGLGRKMAGMRYTTENLALLSLLSNQLCITLENLSLFDQIVEKRVLDEELKLAEEIQKGLLPEAFPPLKDYDLAAISHSSKTVSGDYYDIIPLDGNKICLAVADISGKGVPAAILMANLQAALRTNLELSTNPAKIMEALNRMLYKHTASGNFATFFLSNLDLGSHDFSFANAGHSYPILVGDRGLPRMVEESDLILGMFDDIEYRERRLELKPGELLFLYTDGLTEATNRQSEFFGEERLMDCLVRNHSRPAKKVLDIVLEEIHDFSGGADPGDDITAIVLKRY